MSLELNAILYTLNVEQKEIRIRQKFSVNEELLVAINEQFAELRS